MQDNNIYFSGSICLSDIPKELIRRAMCRDGKERAYLSIAVMAKREPQTYNNGGTERTYTHYVSCAPRKEERKEGVKYILGDLETRTFGAQASQPQQRQAPAPAAPSKADDDLPF